MDFGNEHGQRGCGKTSFVQSLVRNRIFGDGLL